MNLKKAGMSLALFAAGLGAGNRAENYINTRPVQAELERIQAELVRTQQRVSTLREYADFSVGRRQYRANGDRTVSVFGIDGERRVSMPPEEFRKYVKDCK